MKENKPTQLPVTLQSYYALLKTAVYNPKLTRRLLNKISHLITNIHRFFDWLKSLSTRRRKAWMHMLASTVAGAALVFALSTQLKALPNDVIIVDGVCTLSDAITAANTDNATGSCLAGNNADVLDLQIDINLAAELPIITSPITIEGHAHGIYGTGEFRMLNVGNSGSLTLNEATISGGYTANDGGGIFSNGALTVTNSSIVNNEASYGGGIYSSDGTAVIENSTIHGNVAQTDGGGIWHYASDVTIKNSTISGNTAGRDGGGITNYYSASTISNSTVSGNSAGNYGGGIEIFDGEQTLIQSIVSGNDVSSGTPHTRGEEISLYANASYAILEANDHNIIGQNGAGDILVDNSGGGTVVANFGSSGDIIGPSAMLSEILETDATGHPIVADHGGATPTIALVANSPAIDHILNSVTGCSGTDQRGVARPQNGACDVGAFEAEVTSIPLTASVVGQGSILSEPSGIDCGVICAASFPQGTMVTLTAVSTISSTFTSWSGDCSGTGSCVVTIDMAKNVTATFDIAQFYIFLPVILK